MSGYCTSQTVASNSVDASPAIYLYITFLERIALQSYTVKSRTDCCEFQNLSS